MICVQGCAGAIGEVVSWEEVLSQRIQAMKLMVGGNHYDMGIWVVWGAHSKKRVFAEPDDVGSRDCGETNFVEGIPSGVYRRGGERAVDVAVVQGVVVVLRQKGNREAIKQGCCGRLACIGVE